MKLGKLAKRTLTGLALSAALYLGTVWVWATSNVDHLLAQSVSSSPASAIRPQQLHALVLVEDPTFYEHSGVDLSNGQGLTTITSSVATRLFLQGESLDGVSGALQTFYRGVFNCCKRIDFGRDFMALVLDRHASKEDQLNLFLSSAYLGTLSNKSVIGFEAAADAYYGKALAELSDDEFTGIVAMLLAPNYYHPLQNPTAHQQRLSRLKALIAGDCVADGWLDLTYDACETAI